MTHEDTPPEPAGPSVRGPHRDRPAPSRRRLLASTAALGAVSFGGVPLVAAADYDQSDDGRTAGDENDGAVDEPEGFSVEVIAPAMPFPDNVSAMIGVDFEDGGEEFAVLEDASSLLIARATWEPEGTSGWHTHPGPVIVSVIQGTLDIAFSSDCTTHTYEAGEALVDPGGHAEVATNPSAEEEAVIYAVFLGVPDDGSLVTYVEPPEC